MPDSSRVAGIGNLTFRVMGGNNGKIRQRCGNEWQGFDEEAGAFTPICLRLPSGASRMVGSKYGCSRCESGGLALCW